MPNKKSRARLLIRYLAAHRAKAALLGVLVLGNTALLTVNPQLLGRFIDRAESGAGSGALLSVAYLFIGLTLVNQLVVGAAGYFGADLAWLATNRLRGDLAAHTLTRDLEFHHNHTAGELMERVDGDVTLLEEFFSSFVFGVAGNILLVLAILTVTCIADWRIGAVMLLFALLSVWVVRRLQGVAVPQVRKLRESKAELSGFLEERLGATEDIKTSGASAHVAAQLDRLLEGFTRRMKWESVAFRISSSALEIGVSIATAAVLALGAVLLRQGSISLGMVFVGFQYANLVSLTLFRISARMDQFNGAVAGIDRINELFEVRNAVADTGRATLPDGPLEVSFTDVRFGYLPDRPALHGLTFNLPAGQTLGLLGRTGGGKSTIARLLFRGYDPGAGSVRLSGVDIRDVPLAELRRRVAVVTQEVQLFHATVRDNLTLFADGVPVERLAEVLDTVGLSAWLSGLPDGLDTVIGDGGQALSAGEAQLLAFARVFLRDPDVVILDEASSRLDPATEQAVEEAVRRLLDGRTAVVIAHHLATVSRLDRIIVLDEGRILESGPRERLAGDPGSRFSAMLAGAAL